MTYCTGGIQVMIDQMHDRASYTCSAKNCAYVLYNMVKQDIYDPYLFQKFENEYHSMSTYHLVSRHCFGALYAYYKSN
jgi:hypothetical protein